MTHVLIAQAVADQPQGVNWVQVLTVVIMCVQLGTLLVGGGMFLQRVKHGEQLQTKMATSMESMQQEVGEIKLIQQRLADGKERMERLDAEILRNRDMMHDLREDMNKHQGEVIKLLVEALTAKATAR